jgi:bifunctional polynucleotide phosphatase/kinase
MVGPPGSGKSTFWKNHLSKYVRVNNDTLKTADKCMKALREALEAKKSAVIDNTNKTKEERQRYLKIAKEFKVPVRCFFLKYPKDLAMTMNKHRDTNKNREHLSKKVGSVVIHTFYKYLEEP